MLKIHFILFVAVFYLAACSKKTMPQIPTSIPEVMVRPLSKTKLRDTFPYSWLGLWEGNLEIYNAKGLSQSLPMQLDLGETENEGVFKWNIIYGADREKGLRPYLLRTLDASKGLYQNDEVNTIKMEAYYIGSKLFSTFSVQGNLLTSIQEKRGDEMLWEIIFGKEAPVSTTGNQIVKGDTIPAVKTMPVFINQRAVLKRKTQP
jgi:hypothetical protein